MIILGIYDGHNASASLMVDGQIVGMLQEERLTGRKNQTGFPKRAIERLIGQHLAGDVSRIDRVGFGAKIGSLYWTALDHYSNFGVQDYVREMHEYWYPYFYEKGPRTDEEVWSESYWHQRFLSGERLNQDHNFNFSFVGRMDSKAAFEHFNEVERREVFGRHFGWSGEVEFFDHHSCHAHWALWGAPLPSDDKEDALILTGDSRGDNSNWSASILEAGDKIVRLADGLDHHVARIYKFATLILGMQPNEHEYKVMGLASYSRSRRHIEPVERIFHEAVDFRDGKFVCERPLKDSYFDLKERLEGHRFDNVAAGLQNWCTNVTRDWVRHWLSETGKCGLCFSGGLSMNIKTNGELLALDELDWLNVPASGGDESLSAGCCFQMAAEEHREHVWHVYLGEECAADEDWRECLSDEVDADVFGLRTGVGPAEAAQLLANECILARCVGPSEFGARALGNRSILADPSKAANLKQINDAIKQRDFWMPFTPSILSEFANEYLENPKGNVSPFMTIGFASRPEVRDAMAASLHPGDFSARPQFVQKASNADYWTLIDEFRKITGIPLLLNTSLNLHGEPMNYSIADAVRTVYLSGLEFLLLPGNRLLFKKTAESKLTEILDGLT